MATSDFQTEKGSKMKRYLEKELNVSNKRFKIGEETELFCEIQSKKAVRVVGRSGRNWRSSYQKYRSSYYSGRKGRNIVKSRIGNKSKEGNGMKENIENVESSEDTVNPEYIVGIENTDSVTIEESVVWQPTVGSDAFNEGFEVSDLNKIEALVEEGEVFNSLSGEDKGGKIIIFNNDDEEVLEVLEVILMRRMMIMKRDEA